MTLIEVVKIKAKDKGLQFQELADKIGITRITLNQNLNNPNVQLSTLKKVADILEVQVSEIIRLAETNAETPIYTKDEEGKEKIIGWLKK